MKKLVYIFAVFLLVAVVSDREPREASGGAIGNLFTSQATLDRARAQLLEEEAAHLQAIAKIRSDRKRDDAILAMAKRNVSMAETSQSRNAVPWKYVFISAIVGGLAVALIWIWDDRKKPADGSAVAAANGDVVPRAEYDELRENLIVVCARYETLQSAFAQLDFRQPAQVIAAGYDGGREEGV